MEKEITTDTLIIGAGPAGLACAMELSKAGKEFVVIEKEEGPGGLARTYTFKEKDGSIFYTDNGPHRFFSKNPYLYEFIENLIKEDWILVNRQTRQYIDGKFYDYPVNAIQALKNVGILKALRMGTDYLYAKIVFGLFKKPIISFEDYAYACFGKSLAKFNIVNYTEKIWGIPSSEIHPDWAKQRIKGLNLISVLKNSLSKILGFKSGSPKSLVDEFYYPSKGTGLIYETIVDRITKKGYQVLFNTVPEKVSFLEDRVIVSVKSSEGDLKIVCKNLVESVPITKFIKLIDPVPPKEVLENNDSLRHRSQVYLFVTLNKEKITDDQWIYFPSEKNPIARVSEMNNFSKLMSPKGKTSLFVEFFCFEGDKIWNSSKDELLEIVLNSMQGTFFEKEEVREAYLIKKKDVYPVYDLNYEKHLGVVKQYLDQFKNLYYIGRPGRFRYNNQDHSLEMGMLAAKSIVDGIRYDIEAVGDEKEYYESGKIPHSKSD